jgi:hypothetical protein
MPGSGFTRFAESAGHHHPGRQQCVDQDDRAEHPERDPCPGSATPTWTVGTAARQVAGQCSLVSTPSMGHGIGTPVAEWHL